MDTASIASATQAGPKSAQAREKLSSDFDAFLTMLTTQLKNQDPLSPMDSTEFTNQLVQFAQVEQQISANANLESLLLYQEAATLASSTNYLDRKVGYEGTGIALQDGTAEFSFRLDTAADKTTITILDTSGKAVRTMVGETAAGTHNLTWDGLNDQGERMPDGAYRLEVTAIDGEKNAVETTTTAVGRVTDVIPNEGEIMLSVGGVLVPIDTVYTVKTSGSTSLTDTVTN